MKEFSLEEYLKNPNREVVTRDGKKVRIICTDRKGDTPIIALVYNANEGQEYGCAFYSDGKYFIDKDDEIDLFFAPEKHTDYINLYRNGGVYFLGGGVYTSEENAKYIAKGDDQYITTIKVEWEE